MDRKYKQRGYMDSGRERQEKPKQEPRPKGAKEFRPAANAWLPRDDALLDVRRLNRSGDHAGDAVPEMQCGSSCLQAMWLLRFGSAVRMHTADT